MTDKDYRNEIAGAVHEMMSGAHDAGVISAATMRTFDEACLAPAPRLSARISAACASASESPNLSFAAYLKCLAQSRF